MTLRFLKYLLVGTVICLFLPFSCSEDIEARGKALVNILLVDAPGDFDQAWIEILGVEVLPGGTRGESNANWVFLPYNAANKKVNVRSLVAEERVLLGRKELPVGNISQIKLKLGQDHHVVKNNIDIPLTLEQTGEVDITIDVDYDVDNAISYDIFIDFDLERSIHANNSGDGFLLDPQIRSFSRHNTGEISGTVSPPASNPVIYAIKDLDTLSTRTNVSGNFYFWGLDAGSYSIYIQPLETYQDTLFQTSAAVRQLTELETIVLQSSVEEGENEE